MSQTISPTAASNGDNLFGVCAAIGDAFRIDPNILRVVFALSLLVNLKVPILVYLAGAAIVVAAEGLARVTTRRGPVGV